MSHLIDKPTTPPEPGQKSPAGRRLASSRSAGSEQIRTQLDQDLAIDRKALEHLLAEEAVQAQQIAEMEARLEAIKQQGMQLVKQLKQAKQAAEAHRQTVVRLQERIASAEKQLGRGAGVSRTPKIDARQGDLLGQALVDMHRQETPALVKGRPSSREGNLAAGPASVLHKNSGPKTVAGEGPKKSNGGMAGALNAGLPAVTPGAPDAEGYFEANPLIGQLLQYQAIQSRQGRGRRVAFSLGLFVTMAVAIVGFYFLLCTMLGREPL